MLDGADFVEIETFTLGLFFFRSLLARIAGQFVALEGLKGLGDLIIQALDLRIDLDHLAGQRPQGTGHAFGIGG